MRRNHTLCMTGMVCILAAACTDSHNTTVTMINQSTQPRVAIVQPAALPVHPPPLRLMHATVVAGRESTVFNQINLRPDCSVVGLSRIGIVTPPAHGLIAVVEENGMIKAPPGNPYYACSGHPFPATKLKYAAYPDYSGPDSVRIMVRSPDGAYRQYQLALTVKKSCTCALAAPQR